MCSLYTFIWIHCSLYTISGRSVIRILSALQFVFEGTRWHSWLRHCGSSREVAGSIPDVIRIVHWYNPSGCTMALGLIQPLTEMSTRNISWYSFLLEGVGLTT
jgi:hypothetical protein